MAKTRFLILSDTHNQAMHFSTLPAVDVLIHCGDLTMSGKLPEYGATLDMLGKIDAELKLVIAGNHDMSLDQQYFERMGKEIYQEDYDPAMHQMAVKMWVGDAAKKAGVTYLDEGSYTFTLRSGARFTVYASPYQPGFCDWAFPYDRNQDRFNPGKYVTKGCETIAKNPIPHFPAIDIIMTHGPPLGHLDQTANGAFLGCRHLQRAAQRAKPRLYCFGHIHEGYGAERVTWSGVKTEWDTDPSVKTTAKIEGSADPGLPTFIDISESGQHPLSFGKETLMVNAAMLNDQYKPTNAPWIIDMDLPLTT